MTRARTLIRIGAAALLAASAISSPAVAGKADNSLRFGVQVVLQNVDPYFNITAPGGIIADNVWDALIYREPDTGEYRGNLATAWRWIDDRTLELDLRQGVRFHNGAAFDADDVVYTLNYVSKPENRAFNVANLRWIARVEKAAPYRVRIVARQPFPAAVAYLADPRMVIHPHDYYAKVGPKGMSEKPVGSGPFRVAEHVLGKYIRLERNPDYFREGPKARPRIDKVEMRFVPDPQTRVAEAVAGGLDLITDVARDQAEQLRDVRNLQITSGETNTYSLLRLNTLSSSPTPQLRDIRVRQAIAHAIDRETMVRFLTGEDARVVHAECYPEDFGCVRDDVRRYAYDPQRARQLLAEAGYARGFAIDIWAWRDRNEAEAIMGYLAAVGIRARLRFLENAALTGARRAGRVGLTATVWGSGSIFDASRSASVFHGFSADDMNRDVEIRDLFLAADSAMNPDARKAAYAQALGLVAERAYVVPLYTLPAYYIAAQGLAFRPEPDKVLKFYEMSWK